MIRVQKDTAKCRERCMHIKTYASSECIDERGRGHAFAAFLNMQLASTPGLCVCSCCLLTLCACLHVFLAQEDKENS